MNHPPPPPNPPLISPLFVMLCKCAFNTAKLLLLGPVYMEWAGPLASRLTAMLARFYIRDSIMSQPGASPEQARSKPGASPEQAWSQPGLWLQKVTDNVAPNFIFHMQEKHGSLQSIVEYKKFNILTSKHAFFATTYSVLDTFARYSGPCKQLLIVLTCQSWSQYY